MISMTEKQVASYLLVGGTCEPRLGAISRSDFSFVTGPSRGQRRRRGAVNARGRETTTRDDGDGDDDGDGGDAMTAFEAFQGGAHVELFDAKTHRARRGFGRRDGSSRVDGCDDDDDGDGTRGTTKTATRRAWRGGGGRAYDASARGYVVRVRGGGAGALACGEDGAMGATQPILAMQLRASGGANFSFEVRVRDAADARRRLVFSSSFSEVRPTPLHCQVPLRDLPRDEWVTLLLPLVELVPVCFSSGSAGYRSIDAIVIRGECSIRKIFTLRGDTQAQAWTESRAGETPRQAIVIPRECDFPPGVRAAAHTVIPSQDPALYDAHEEECRVRERNREVRMPIKVAFGRRAPTSQRERRRERADAAPARASDDHTDVRWSDLDQIMSNLRVRDAGGAGVRHSLASSSSSSSYASSRRTADEAAEELDMRNVNVSLGNLSIHGGREHHRYADVDDEDVDEGDEDVDEGDEDVDEDEDNDYEDNDYDEDDYEDDDYEDDDYENDASRLEDDDEILSPFDGDVDDDHDDRAFDLDDSDVDA